MKYLILQNPGHNRVYYNSADKLALAELELATIRMSVKGSDVQVEELEGIRYLSFQTEAELNLDDYIIISRLSFVFALFKQVEVNDKRFLEPVSKIAYEYVDPKISSLLKYQGKTNELFTKMMINVALLSSNFSHNDNIYLLDPVAGKGTTLFESTVYGYQSYGIELEPKSVNEVSIFFKKFLEAERIKHRDDKRMISGTKKADAITIHEFEYARSKEEFKEDDKIKRLGIVTGNTNNAHKYFKKELFHLIVGDLPYGIFHGNTGDAKTPGITRNPVELLENALAEWKKVLLKGGAVVVAWNSNVVSRHKLSGIFADCGFDVLTDAPYDTFEHMVDKSIKRDIIVAKK